ncbi:MAG: glycoside hydrolase, partial [Bacteroidaceae bacterium]|nr:glycoside hydrolase [Bacteroidaceae bacterium]
IAAYFYSLWKEPKQAAHYERKAETLRDSIMEHFWDTTQKAFINGYRSDGSRDERISHHAQYWAVLTGLYPERFL